jgi:fatty-acyl-CoA synthase
MTIRTVAQALEQAAAQSEPWRGYRFIHDEGRSEPFYSFASLERTTARYGGNLQRLGLKKGDRLALVLSESDDFVFTFLGALRAGMVPVPLYPPPASGQLAGYLDNTRRIVKKSGAKALITSRNHARLFGTIQAGCSHLKQIIAIEQLYTLREELQPVQLSPDDMALIQFTSGSTSDPKGVILTHGNLSANVEAINHVGLQVRPDDVAVSWLPLFHDMGLIGFVIAPLFARVPTILLKPFSFLRHPAIWLRTISTHRASISYGPNFAYALTTKRVKNEEIQGVDLQSWRIAGCGAEPIRAETLEQFAQRFSAFGFQHKAFVPSYGLAESTLAVSFQPVDQGPEFDVISGPTLWQTAQAEVCEENDPGAIRLVRCGHVFPGHSVGVFGLDDDQCEHPLAERQVGELRIKGPSVMRGYINDPEKTAEVIAGAWLHTGDLGYLADGHVIVCGRYKEMIIVNGRNFYPQDIEWEASKIPGVRKGNIIAFGCWKPNTDREKVVVLFETTQFHSRDKNKLASEVRQVIYEGLGLFIDEAMPMAPGSLPKTSSGKPRRLWARQQYENDMKLSPPPTEVLQPVVYAKELLRSQLSYLVRKLAPPSRTTRIKV